MTINRGQFAFTPIENLPGWYLTHLVGGIADVKWDELTEGLQGAIQAEVRKREAETGPAGQNPPLRPRSGLESAQETHARNVATGAVPPADGKAIGADAVGAQAPPAGAPPASETAPSSTFTAAAFDVTAATVDEAHTYIATVFSIDELDALKKTEKAGKDRVGVLSAIDDRKVILKAEEKEKAKAAKEAGAGAGAGG